MDFKTKLAFALVSASLLSMTALGFFTYLWAADMLLEDAKRQLSVVADGKQSQIRGVVDDWMEDLQEVVDGLESAAALEALRPESPRAAKLLREAAASSHRIREVALLEAGGGATRAASTGGDGVELARFQTEPQQPLSVVWRAPVRGGLDRPRVYRLEKHYLRRLAPDPPPDRWRPGLHQPRRSWMGQSGGWIVR